MGRETSHLATDRTPGPFRVRCLRCDTIVESWHRDVSTPKGATIGMAYCQCGNIGADSLVFQDFGRVLFRNPNSYEVVTDKTERPE
ncbi:hypothetical protein [Paracoccus saliphilus]|uniref:Uncharacterized protein n=1 Tax=Paracoccus saliphilus TaxID=405559 RepID=A0AA45W6J7_9RHOB|nr:hypothetical protein [Paracoccus saliphilus]WCR04383.1 hypothetical protein JHX88_06540 [Paracoccus saliphilus]SIT02090.1 hypothetical protein SAMN05421772_112139 [Paracoccus saliphilus]